MITMMKLSYLVKLDNGHHDALVRHDGQVPHDGIAVHHIGLGHHVCHEHGDGIGVIGRIHLIVSALMRKQVR